MNVIINPLNAKLYNLNFHPFEIVARYRDPQLQMGENYSHLLNLRPNICKSLCFNIHFIHNNCDLSGQEHELQASLAVLGDEIS